MTSATLLATSIVAIKRDGCFTKFESMRPEKFPFLRSISMRSLFEERNAISVPDESAEAMSVMITMVRALNSDSVYPSFPLSRGGKEGSGIKYFIIQQS